MAVTERLKHAWNAFMGRDPTYKYDYGYSSFYRPDRVRLSGNNLKSIVASIYNQISIYCASVNINHVRLDENGNFKEIINSSLNTALSLDANLDQTGRALIQDVVMSMLDEGCVAIVPTDTDRNPDDTDSYEIEELRVGKILEWKPKHVYVEVYNENNGKKERILLEKRFVAIVENPFYAIMNEPNSTAKRLIRVLNQLDQMNANISANKLDIIIQMPYSTQSKSLRERADQRVKTMESQLASSPFGIAYADGTEKIVQLNRPVENNLWTQAKELQQQLYNQLGFTQSIFDGTADESTMINFNNRCISPIVTAIVEEMERKWISKTARTQKQAIRFFNDPFRLVPVSQLAEIGDKFVRNEILSTNEVRSKLGMKPSDDPKANELRNPNLNHPDEEGTTSTVIEEVKKEE